MAPRAKQVGQCDYVWWGWPNGHRGGTMDSLHNDAVAEVQATSESIAKVVDIKLKYIYNGI